MGSRRSLPARALAPLLVAFFATLLAAESAKAPPPRGDDPPPPESPLFAERDLFRPDELVLRLEPARGDSLRLGDGSELSNVLERYGATRVEPVFRASASAKQSAARSRTRFSDRTARAPDSASIPDFENVFVVQLSGPTDVLQAVAEAAALPGVVHAEPNALYRVTATPLPDASYRPNDRYVSEDGMHWSAGAWGRGFSDLYGIEKVRGIEAWSRFDSDGSGGFEPAERRPGEGIVVAVVDTGLDVLHPDIAENLWRNEAEVPQNGLDDDGNGFIDDVHGWDFVDSDPDPEDLFGHGTHVAGTVAARGDNTIGVVGVAPFARVMPLKGLGDDGFGDAVTLANAVRYAADMGADVLSSSWGGQIDSAVLESAFLYAASLGTVLVASAGNSSIDVVRVFPAGYEDVIAVAATDANDLRAPFSNFGEGIDVSAPGVEVLSLNANAGDNAIARGNPANTVAGSYLQLSGTSMSCPHVAGAAAVLLGRRPGETSADVRARLVAGAESIAAMNPGFERLLGRGRLDLDAALVAEPRPLVEISRIDTDPLTPGVEVEVVIHLRNRWIPAANVTAILSSQTGSATVTKAEAGFGDLPGGSVVSNREDAFRVLLDEAAAFGEALPFRLELSGAGYAETLALSLVPTQFADVSEELGLPLFETVPWSVGLHDFDGDEDVDAHFIGFFANAFFRNLAGRFEFASDLGVFPPTVGSSQALFLDIENDGDEDIFWAGFNDFTGSRLFLNGGGGVFSDVTDASGTRGLRAFTAAAFDYDRDGLVDFLGGSHPLGVGSNRNALFLMRNNGDGSFSDVAPQACLDTTLPLLLGQTFVFDYDDDGDPDLLLASPADILLYRNDDDGTFTDVSSKMGIAPYRHARRACQTRGRRLHGRPCAEAKALGGALGDYDGDGDIDVFLTGRGVSATHGFNALYRNDGAGGFTDVTREAGDLANALVSGMPRGNEFFDYDNDGDLDLYVTNEGISEILTNMLYRNEGDGSFRAVTHLAFSREKGPSGAAAGIGDYNGDGALDIYAPSGLLGRGGRGAFFENRFAQRNHWLVVRLEGVVSHRDAFGARVSVRAGGRTQLRELHEQSLDPRPLHFGLGEATTVEEIRVRWPSGIVESLPGMGIDRVVEIAEPADCDAGGIGTILACPEPVKDPGQGRALGTSQRCTR